ncbi:Ecm9p KNAG_0A06860 [Huiozyma naganishii CBS 8797]|uniref:Protein ECM9 n=1 Tax=Huiozyma naganishii (strain ATCC MYA-139 / BCRC 22969 / CBS 8797 / KCTC 17520 / NBRC 10181 / NCYC 3082 / Yp74L-3) TaxID=1071383 RepID=J7R0K7_HUIN7|nr:hypothetical protein KNAG_0A06860 [Kazachstania naganishii CBS 8797]CCK68340.1 hypothetical protein KNAG_0A06860 [Kazachstania naganishii CBS 8797]
MEGQTCQSLYKVLVQEPLEEQYTLSFVPNRPDLPKHDLFLTINEPNCHEIICFKSTWLMIFREAHDYINDKILHSNTNSNGTVDQFLLYQMTIGLLMTTAENKMNLNLHKGAFFRCLTSSEEDLKFLRREIAVVSRLLTCTNNKINKSSSLWCWYRQLFALWNRYRLPLDLWDTDIFMRSGSKHFSNYYCWNTCRWIFDNLTDFTVKEKLFHETKRFAFQNTRDSSCWHALTYMACQQQTKNIFAIKDYETLNKGRVEGTPEIVWLPVEILKLQNEIVKFIDTFTISEWPAYLFLLSIVQVFSLPHTLFHPWMNDVYRFEEENGMIQLQWGFYSVIPKALEVDLLKYSMARHMAMKKTFFIKLGARR